MNILVYLGSSEGNKKYFKEAALEVADWICDHNYGLVYGANRYGLMGILANRVLERNCEVTGVIPKFLLKTEIPHENLTNYIEVETMQERKDYMRSISNICIALPGGPGTLEEITEAISLYRVNQSDNICVFYNKEGYYNPIKKMYDDMLRYGFINEEDRKNIIFVDDIRNLDNELDNFRIKK